MIPWQQVRAGHRSVDEDRLFQGTSIMHIDFNIRPEIIGNCLTPYLGIYSFDVWYRLLSFKSHEVCSIIMFVISNEKLDLKGFYPTC